MTPSFNAVSRSRAAYLITTVWTAGQVLLGNWFFLCFYASALVGSVLNIWDLLFEKIKMQISSFLHWKYLCSLSAEEQILSSTRTLWLMNPPGLCSIPQPQLPASFRLSSSFLLTGPPVHLHAAELTWAPVLQSESVSRSVVSNSLRPYRL